MQSPHIGAERTYYAHSANAQGHWQPLREHLRNVATEMRKFGEAFDFGEEAELTGLLHDVGKYSPLFLARLEGKVHGLDHWSPGAWIALQRCRCIAAALAIQGHHIGLQRADKDSLLSLNPARRLTQQSPELRLTEKDTDLLLKRFGDDGLSLPCPPTPLYPRLQTTAAAMLDVRMLYSALVDADFLDTEAHLGEKRAQGVPLEASRMLQILQERVAALAADPNTSREVKTMRAALWQAALKAAEGPFGLYTLTAPTGAGKTLAMLGFALKHAAKHGLRRIVVVLPYLNILDQTVRVYRDLFDGRFPPYYLIEDHSLVGTRTEPVAPSSLDQDAEATAQLHSRLLSENWDAPIIVTTSVQCLESLFASRPSACRKLHRLAMSILLFDEVQTLPLHLAIPTAATLSWLAQRYHSTVLFATATQPAFTHLDGSVRRLACSGWQPREVVPTSLRLFERARRTTVQWPQQDETVSLDQLAEWIADEPQALCIVNLKRHAISLFQRLKEKGVEGLCHLSTNMCPAHRRFVLSQLAVRLDPNQPQPCRLISTQCVEAGVDVDFPVVFRAFAPLDSIAQAAGRCNRNARLPSGRVVVFRPEVEGSLYPSHAYEQAASVTESLLASRGPNHMDINDPRLFETYYRLLYDVVRLEKLRPPLTEAILQQDFEKVAREYRLIDQDAINVLVPYPKEIELFQRLCQEAVQQGITRQWMQHARPLTVALFRPRPSDPVLSYLEPLPISGRHVAEDWFAYREAAHYDEHLGLIPPAESAVLIA